MRRIALILDTQSAKGFSASDIEIIRVDSDLEAKERLGEIINKKEFGFVIINKDLIGDLPMGMKKIIEASKDPMLIPIDIEKDEPMDLKRGEELSQMVYRAVGAQLRRGDRVKDGN